LWLMATAIMLITRIEKGAREWDACATEEIFGPDGLRLFDEECALLVALHLASPDSDAIAP